MSREYKYIHFDLVAQKRKTSVWSCRNNASGEEIGRVQWYGPWRQYCFYPAWDSVFSMGCLDDIRNFIEWIKGGAR